MEDPFSTPRAPSSSGSGSRMSSPPTFALVTSSPAQLKRTLQSHIAETEKRLVGAAQLGQDLMKQQQELQDRLQELEESGEEVTPELTKKLGELEREYNEVGRETTRALLTSKIMNTGDQFGGNLPTPTSSALQQAQSFVTPNKLNVPSRKQRNQPSRNQDLEFAAELGQGLLVEIRKLQGLLGEKEESLKKAQEENERLEETLLQLETRLKAMDESDSRYKEENWNLELSIQELRGQQADQREAEARLQAQIAQLAHEKTIVVKELDDLKQQHKDLSEELDSKYKSHDVEVSALRRTLQNKETETDGLHKLVVDLKGELEESHKITVRLRNLDHRSSDEALQKQSQTLELPMTGEETPNETPPISPMKHTPRHSMLESETLKSSLTHAHRVIQNLKSNIHREKTEKAELKRILQETREELETARTGFGGPLPTNSKRRKDGKFGSKKSARPDINLLGPHRKSRDEIVAEFHEDEWEETPHNDSDFPRGAIPGAFMSSVPPTDREDAAFETANETDVGFHTANDGDVTETDAYRTGMESPVNDNPTSADDLTETETSIQRVLQKKPSRRLSNKSMRAPRMTNLRFRSDSVVSTASTEDEGDDVFGFRHTVDSPGKTANDELDPGMSPLAISNPRLKLRVNRRNKSSRGVSDGAVFNNLRPFGTYSGPNSPRSPLSDDSTRSSAQQNRLQAVQGMGKSLFAELGDSPGMVSTDNDSEPETPTKIVHTLAVQMTDSEMNTEPYEPEPVIHYVDRDVPVEVIKEVETIREVQVPYEVVKELPVPFEVIKEITKEVPVERIVEIIKEVPVPFEVIKEITKEVPVERIVEIIKEVPVPFEVIKEIIKEVPVEKEVELLKEIIKEVQVPVETIREIVKEVPVEIIREVIIEAERKPSTDAGTQSLDILEHTKVDAGTQPDSTKSSVDFGTQYEPTEENPAETTTPAPSILGAIAAKVGLPTENATPEPLQYSEINSLDTEPASPASEKTLTLSDINTQSTQPIVPPSSRAPHFTAFDATSSDEDNYPTPKKVSETIDEGQRPVTPERKGGLGLFGIFGGRKVAQTTQTDAEKEGDDDDTIRKKGVRVRPGLPTPVTDQGAQTEISTDYFTPRVEVASKSPSLHSKTSHESMVRRRGSNEGVPLKRPGSSSSMKESRANYPPLPPDHRENIAAYQLKMVKSRDSNTMPPPPLPTSSPNEYSSNSMTSSFRPVTPNDYGRRSTTPSGHGPLRAPKPRFSATRSEVSSPGSNINSRRSSLSSFVSEVDEHFNAVHDGYPRTQQQFEQKPTTDPKLIQAITQTMIGEYLWKYTRNAGRGTISQSRHKRFFWVHPYTRTLYWSDRDPTIPGKSELRTKSVNIEAIRVVTDDNPSPPGLHRKSLVVITPGRSIKFTAPTSQRHDTWFNALSYLLLRSGSEEVEAPEAPYNDDDIHEYGSIRMGSHSLRAPSFTSRTSRTESPSAMSSRRISEREKERFSGSISRLSNMFRSGSAMGTYSTHSQSSRGNLASLYNNSTEDLDASSRHTGTSHSHHHHHEDGDQLENVRACCDGRHDVATLSRRGGHVGSSGRRSAASYRNSRKHSQHSSHG